MGFYENGSNILDTLAKRSEFSSFLPPSLGVLTTGNNSYGQLGIGNYTHVSTPGGVNSATNFIDAAVTKNGQGIYYIGVDGNAYYSGIGYDSASTATTKTQVGSNYYWNIISGHDTTNHGVRTDGSLWSWGRNNYGQLGLGDTIDRSTPTQISNETNWSTSFSSNSVFAAIKQNGTLWTCGLNDNGQLGVNDTANKSTLTQVGASADWSKISVSENHALALKYDGTIWSFGLNSDGQLGHSDTASKSSPVQIGSLTDWEDVAVGNNFSLAIKTDGTLWTWGNNNFGQLGHSDTTSKSSPVQVGVLLNWNRVHAGDNFAIITKTDGTAWACGKNSNGQLGLGNTTDLSSPAQIGSTGWDSLSITKDTVFGLTFDDNYYGWGLNDNYQLGVGDLTNRSVPTQINEKLYHRINGYMAVRNDGTLWSSGPNSYGQLGQFKPQMLNPNVVLSGDFDKVSASNSSGFFREKGTKRIYSTDHNEIDVDSLASWSSFDTGSYHFVGVKTDGSAWSVGSNTYGQLGLGDNSHRSELSLINFNNNNEWQKVVCNDHGSMLIDQWYNAHVFGKNDNGQLGPNDTTHRNVPIILRERAKSASFDNYALATINLSSNARSLTSPVDSVLVNTQEQYDNYIINTSGGFIIMSDGSLWASGLNNSGQLGLNYTSTRVHPFTRVGYEANWSQISGGDAHTMAIKTDGTLWAWGNNNFYGQLGLSNTTNRSSPVQVGALTNWSKVSCGNSHTMAIKTDGTLWAWGNNAYGQLGLPNTTNRSSPVQVGTLTNWSKVSCGDSHTMAVKTDGTLWSWGLNSSGQLGLSNTTNRLSPVQVGALTNWSKVSCGDTYTMAVKTDGTLWSWGNNSYGQLGVNSGTNTHRSSPVQVGSATDWVEINPQTYTMFACNDSRELYYSGRGSEYWFDGNYNVVSIRPIPTEIMPYRRDVVSIGYDHMISYTGGDSNNNTAIMIGVGANSYGQLGFGDQTHRESIGKYDYGIGWRTITSGDNSRVHGIKLDGSLWSWGYNVIGHLPSPTTGLVPLRIGNSTDWSKVESGYDHYVAVKTDGTLWTWGYGANGVLGLSDVSNRWLPTQVGALTDWSQISCGNAHTMSTKTDGTLWSWGRNDHGQLGLSDTTNRSSPVQVGALTDWSQISGGDYHTMAVKTDGTLWAWGNNFYGQLGLSDTTNRSSPVQVGTLTNWSKVSCGDSHTMAVKTDGTLWAWGYNNYGQLALNDITHRSSPVQVGGLTDWSTVSLKTYSLFATKTDGSVWACGYNNSGQLGLPDTTNRSSPIQIGSGYTSVCANGGINNRNQRIFWGANNVYQLGLGYASGGSGSFPQIAYDLLNYAASGNDFSLTRTNTNAVFGVGKNNYGQLGVGDTVDRSMPTLVNTTLTFTQIAGGESHAIFVSTFGIYACGNNSYGQLGTNNLTHCSIPTQIRSGGHIDIACGKYHTAFIDVANQLWTVGNNSYGQLGTNDQTHRSSLVIIGGSTWYRVGCGDFHTMATKTNGTLWSWGRNDYGQLGLSNTTNRSSPVQVGALTNWTNIDVDGIQGGSLHSTIVSNGLWTCGNNSFGQLGLGDQIHRSTFALVGTNISAVSSNQNATAYIQTYSGYNTGYGVIYTVGENTFNKAGTLFKSTDITTGNDSSSVTVNNDSIFVTKNDGSMMALGNNTFGKLGNGGTSYVNTITTIPLSTGNGTNTLSTIKIDSKQQTTVVISQ